MVGTYACWKAGNSDFEDGRYLCMLESGQDEERILLFRLPTLQIFEQQQKAAAEADLENLKMIVDERQLPWLQNTFLSSKMTQQSGWKYRATMKNISDTGKVVIPAAEVILNLAEWVQLDLVGS